MPTILISNSMSHARSGTPRELGHNELKSALNRGEIRAHLIGLPELQTVFGIVGKPGHSARIAVEVPSDFLFRGPREAGDDAADAKHQPQCQLPAAGGGLYQRQQAVR